MLVLNIRSLDSSCRRLEVGADAAIPMIRAQLVQSLPPFHDFHLIQDGREIVDGEAIEMKL